MRLNITIVTSCDFTSINLNVTFSSFKFENGLKKHVRKVADIKYGLVKSIVIFFTFTKCLNLFTSKKA